MSDGLRSRPYVIAKDLAIAARNAAAKLRLGVAEGDWEDGVTNLEDGDPGPRAHVDQLECWEAAALHALANSV